MRARDRETERFKSESGEAFQIKIINPDNDVWKKTNIFQKIKSDILEKLVEEKALDDKFQLMKIYHSMEVMLVETNGMNFVTYKVTFDYKKYLFSYNKTGGIWQRTAFSEYKMD